MEDETVVAGRRILSFFHVYRSCGEHFGDADADAVVVPHASPVGQVDDVRDTFRSILQMSLVMTYGGSVPVIKVRERAEAGGRHIVGRCIL